MVARPDRSKHQHRQGDTDVDAEALRRHAGKRGLRVFFGVKQVALAKADHGVSGLEAGAPGGRVAFLRLPEQAAAPEFRLREAPGLHQRIKRRQGRFERGVGKPHLL